MRALLVCCFLWGSDGVDQPPLNGPPPAWTNLQGRHFKFTVMHDPPGVDVGLNDGVVLPKDQWNGFVLTIISQIATLANFSYELYLPSGNGTDCRGNTITDWARQYTCGQQDTEAGLTHAYWNVYVTDSRWSHAM